jgi:tetratricopeptide (TPR) repeat protein
MQKNIALSLAFAVATLSLLLAGGQRAVAPFGWSAVIVACALATLPLTVAAASGACALWPVLRHRGAVVLLAPAGLLLGWLTFQYGGSLGPRLEQQEVGSLLRMVIRLLWPLTLQLPWALLAFRCGEEPTEPTELRPGRAIGLTVAAMAIAVVLPNMYLDDMARRRIDDVNVAIGQGRLAKAAAALEPICEAGAWHQRVNTSEPGLKLRPTDARRYWEEQLDLLKKEVTSLRRTEPTPATQRAIALAERALGDIAAARREISDLADRDSAAALLMAQTYHDERNWSETERWCRRAVDLAETHEQPAQLRPAFDALAAVSSQQRRFQEAEAVYLRAIDELPQAEAHFRFQLGRHYELVGRPLAARGQWEEAARLDPAQYRELVDAAIAGELNSPTPGCLLGPLR